jgi:short-subunit dehydrogenase
MHKYFQDKVALITGSSRGIGKATAIELAKRGALLVLNGRDRIRLEKAAKEVAALGVEVLVVCLDISIPNQAKQLIELTIERFGRLDILINNAAVSMRGNFADLDPIVYKTTFDTNVLGCVNVSIPAMPYLRESRGSILFISSLAAIRSLPNQSAYCASKMALRGIADSIRIEEKHSNIHVGLIYVGITENEDDKKVMTTDGSFINLKEHSIFRIQTLNSVAKAILKNIQKRRYRTILSPIGKLLAILQSLFPTLVDRAMLYAVKKNIREAR